MSSVKPPDPEGIAPPGSAAGARPPGDPAMVHGWVERLRAAAVTFQFDVDGDVDMYKEPRVLADSGCDDATEYQRWCALGPHTFLPSSSPHTFHYKTPASAASDGTGPFP